MKFFSTLLSVILSVFVNSGAQNQRTDHSLDHPDRINLSRDLVRLGIASRNMTPDDPALDSRPLFQAAITFVRKNHTQIVEADHGAYYFLTPENAQTYLGFNDLSDVSFDLADSTIHFAGAFLQGFTVAHCRHVTLSHFETDFLNPPYTHVRLELVDPQRRTLSYTTLPAWADPITFNGVTTPLGPPVLFAVAFRNGSIVPGTSRMQISQPISGGVLQLVPSTSPWTQPATLSTLEPGDTIVLTQRGGESFLVVFESDAVMLSNATIHGASAIAVQFISTSRSNADHIRVVPRPGNGLVASNADGIHLSDSGPDNHIRHSFITQTLDDAMAIDSLDIATAVSQLGPRQITVRRTFSNRFPDGTAVNFVDPVSAAELKGATIVSQNPPDSLPPVSNGTVELTFDHDLPRLATGFGMAFADRQARGEGSSIEENEIGEIPFGRGIWVGGAQGVTIEHNRIGHTSNGGIVVSQDTKAFPGPPAHDVLIQSNRLQGSLGPMASGTGSPIATGAIVVESTNNTFSFVSSSPNTNINIRGNRIVDSGRSGIWVGQLDRGRIEDNVIIGWDQHPELPLFGVNAQTAALLLEDFTQPLVVHSSENVEVRDNTTRMARH